MGIASLVAWLWMAGQGGNVVSAQDVAKWGYSGYLRTAPPASVAPASHVVEIRTKREPIDTATPKCPDIWPSFEDTKAVCQCPDGLTVTVEGNPDNASVSCVRVTREIWIDGVKFGVLKETQ